MACMSRDSVMRCVLLGLIALLVTGTSAHAASSMDPDPYAEWVSMDGLARAMYVKGVFDGIALAAVATADELLLSGSRKPNG